MPASLHFSRYWYAEIRCCASSADWGRSQGYAFRLDIRYTSGATEPPVRYCWMQYGINIKETCTKGISITEAEFNRYRHVTACTRRGPRLDAVVSRNRGRDKPRGNSLHSFHFHCSQTAGIRNQSRVITCSQGADTRLESPAAHSCNLHAHPTLKPFRGPTSPSSETKRL